MPTTARKGRSKSRNKARKPQWPYPNIVTMTAHPSGYWCKKIKGKLYYFGPIDQPDVALARYQEDGPDLHAGRVPRRRRRGQWIESTTVANAANAFMSVKTDQLDAGEISPNTWRDYHRMLDFIVGVLGRTRRAQDLGPADFADLRAAGGKRWGPWELGKMVVVTRMLFRFAYDHELIDAPLRFGEGFRKPDLVAKRRARRAKGRQVFTAEEIRTLYQATTDRGDHQMRAMILLAINGGLGQTDCAELPMNVLDLKEAVLDYERPKTGVQRIVPMWPETVEALRQAIEHRPSPRTSVWTERGGPVFVTMFGLPWVRQRVSRIGGQVEKVVPIDSVSLQFGKLRKALLPDEAPAFYGLRHTFRTVADELPGGDQHAVHRIMGHSLPGMSDVYVERITVDRCRRVTDHVRQWLFAGWSCPIKTESAE